MLTWKTLVFAVPVAASLLAANSAQAAFGGHGGGGLRGGDHGHFDRGGFSHHFDHRGFFFGSAFGLGALLGGTAIAAQPYYYGYYPPVYAPYGYFGR
jgi:hypothetical protein